VANCGLTFGENTAAGISPHLVKMNRKLHTSDIKVTGKYRLLMWLLWKAFSSFFKLWSFLEVHCNTETWTSTAMHETETDTSGQCGKHF